MYWDLFDMKKRELDEFAEICANEIEQDSKQTRSMNLRNPYEETKRKGLKSDKDKGIMHLDVDEEAHERKLGKKLRDLIVYKAHRYGSSLK